MSKHDRCFLHFLTFMMIYIYIYMCIKLVSICKRFLDNVSQMLRDRYIIEICWFPFSRALPFVSG